MFNLSRNYPYRNSQLHVSRSELEKTLIPRISESPPPHCNPPAKKTSFPPKKIDFKTIKKETCTSLNDVECFLNNFSHTLKYIKLIKLLK